MQKHSNLWDEIGIRKMYEIFHTFSASLGFLLCFCITRFSHSHAGACMRRHCGFKKIFNLHEYFDSKLFHCQFFMLGMFQVENCLSWQLFVVLGKKVHFPNEVPLILCNFIPFTVFIEQRSKSTQVPFYKLNYSQEIFV